MREEYVHSFTIHESCSARACGLSASGETLKTVG
jgi:hypothetical protein